jgi:4-methyl-5(b-hydroxyethyl)-thiazole monophosphate biosynthesis
MKKVLIPIADASEEVEAVITIDLLRRAGIHVVVASIYPDRLQVTASRKTKLVADALLSEVAHQSFDMIIIPGGLPGAAHLRDSEVLTKLLLQQNADNKWIAAICAAPVYVLQTHGILQGKAATCFPGEQNNLKDQSRADETVVVDHNCITSQGVGTAIPFALEIIKQLEGQAKSSDVARAIVFA